MPEPDFDQILKPLIDKLSDAMDPDNAADFVRRTMRQVWNARGAADATAVQARTIELVAGEVVGAGIARHFNNAIHALDH